MSTARTLATGSSFRASEAQDVGCFGLVGQISDVFAIFPQSHTLIVVPAFVLVADTMRIANEEGSHLLFDTQVDDFVGGFVPQVPNTPLGMTALLVFGSLQLLPAPGILFAPSLLFG